MAKYNLEKEGKKDINLIDNEPTIGNFLTNKQIESDRNTNVDTFLYSRYSLG